MRLARTFWDADRAQLVAAWLTDRGVEFELQPYPQENPISWRLWILDQDKLAAVCTWVDEIESGKILLEDISKDSTVASPASPSPTMIQEIAHAQLPKASAIKKPQGAWFTQSIIIILVVIHLTLHMMAAGPVASYWKDALLMDNPSLNQEEVMAAAYSDRASHELWPGLYRLALRELQTQKEPLMEGNDSFSGDFLISVRKGEIWRLVTPALLHGDWIHLLFNVLWLSLLGTTIEPRLGSGRMALLMLFSAIVSNLAQYIMSGYNFLGFSGVVMALVAFAYVRIKKFPWEGYRLSLSTFTFIGFYLILTLCLQLMSFILDAFAIRAIVLNTANTAHISGLFVGWLLGQMRLMAIKQ